MVRGLLLIAAVAAGCGTVAETARTPVRPSLSRYGLTVTLPTGWRASIEHGAVRAQGPEGTVDIFEDDPRPESDIEEYPEGRPELGPDDLDDFNGVEEDSRLTGHGFGRRLFSLSGRRFVVFVETESPEAPLDAVNDLLASLEVEPGDFYPGTVEPAWFASRPGWHVGTSGPAEVRADGEFVTTWAATIPYADAWNALPPFETLDRLPRDGIVIWVGLSRTNRYPPEFPAAKLPAEIADMDYRPSWEGQVRDLPEYVLWGTLGDRVQLDLRVYFGRPDPTREQRDEAEAMLAGLSLPAWPAWED